MTGRSHIKNSDLAFSPSFPSTANASAAAPASMSLKVGADAAAPHTVVADEVCDAPALMGVSSLDLPAASSGVAGLSPVRLANRSDCIGEVHPTLEAAICDLEANGFDIKNSTTFRVAAASEIISNSTSSVGA